MFRKGGYHTYIIKMFGYQKWGLKYLCNERLNANEGVACWSIYNF